MKVVLAMQPDDANVIGLLNNTDDEVVFMNNWLHHHSGPGQRRPSGFKVYNFQPGVREPMTLGTMLYLVTYQEMEGRV